jgi:hypothetical protein
VTLFAVLGLILPNYPDVQQEVKHKIISSFPADNTTQAGVKEVKIHEKNLKRKSIIYSCCR